MPDIAMCKNTGCHRYKECYRAQAKPTPLSQSYFTGSPRKKKVCKYFITIRDRIRDRVV